jgi:hypothetical protein
MKVLIHEFTSEVTDPDGHVYRARAFGRPRKDGTWIGWIEFTPRSGNGLTRRTGMETTQPNRDALEYWTGGIEPVYLEGALERATLSPAAARASSG